MKPLALLLTAVIFGLPALAEPVTLRVMSFNVRYGTAMDKENAWPKRKNILVNCIRTANPDLLGVQECLDFQAKYIAEQIPDFDWVGIGRDKGGKGEMTAVFYRKSLLEKNDARHFWLSETPDVPASVSWDSSLTRMATMLKFTHKPSSRPLVFVNTHLDHKGEQARQQGIGVIDAQTAAYAPDLPLILTGDFNAAGGLSKPHAIAIEKGFKDSWIETADKKGPPVTWSNFEAPKPGTDSRIDWIMYKGNIKPLSCETMTYNENGRYPSDHFPVLAVLEIN